MIYNALYNLSFAPNMQLEIFFIQALIVQIHWYIYKHFSSFIHSVRCLD